MYPTLTGWAQYNHRGPYKEEAGELKTKVIRQWEQMLESSDDGGRSHKPITQAVSRS